MSHCLPVRPTATYTPIDTTGSAVHSTTPAASTDKSSQSTVGAIFGGLFGALLLISIITVVVIITLFLHVRMKKKEDYFIHEGST